MQEASQPKPAPLPTKESVTAKPRVSLKTDSAPSQLSPSTSSWAAGDSKPSLEMDKPSESLLWVDKYKPQNMKQLIGQQGDRSCANKLLKWLRRWHDNNFGPNKDRGEDCGQLDMVIYFLSASIPIFVKTEVRKILLD